MTYAIDKGFVVGKYYKVVGGMEFKIGAIVKFTEDDGSGTPRFDGKSTDKTGWNYVWLDDLDNTPVEETPAMKAGLVVGKKYKVLAGASDYFAEGTKVKFVKDDGSTMPKFKGIGTSGEKESYFLTLDWIKLPKKDKVD